MRLLACPTARLFLDRVQRAFIHSMRHPEYKFALLFIDVDDFKKFNDSFGYAAGDAVIVELASRLASSLRRHQAVARLALMPHGDDTLARLGGDEFAVLLDDIKDPSDAIRVANRIQEAVGGSFRLQRPGSVLLRQHRHRAEFDRPRPRRGPAARRRYRHVPRQDGGESPLRGVRRGHARPGR